MGRRVLLKAAEKLEYNKMQHRFWALTYNGDHEFEIDDNDGYVVDFKNPTYTCRHCEISGIPCSHSILAIYFRKEQPEKYMSRYYRALNREKLWRKTPYAKFLPLRLRRMPRRPKKQRNKELHEARRNNPTEISRKTKQMKCSKCGEYGHNKKTCKEPPNMSSQSGTPINLSIAAITHGVHTMSLLSPNKRARGKNTAIGTSQPSSVVSNTRYNTPTKSQRNAQKL
ncbi:hypothetical protein LguiA_036413 [Lonicera macranthoides]